MDYKNLQSAYEAIGDLLKQLQAAAQPRPDIITPGETGKLENSRPATFAGRLIRPGETFEQVLARPQQESPDAEGMGVSEMGKFVAPAAIAKQVVRVPGSAEGHVFGAVQGIKGYRLIDTKTGNILAEYAPHQAKLARARMDRMDNAYGAYRYSVQPIYENPPK